MVRLIFITLLIGILQPVLACLWDYDTLEMEKEQFPSVLELIAGKFLRHSPALYYWRIKDRTIKIENYPDSLKYYDDLAVAYSKIGKHKKAIAIMNEKEKRKPNLYETYANMGTFYIFDGDLKKALFYIDKALEINENAHFGREIYQKYLVQYLLKVTRKGKIKFPLHRVIVKYPQAYYGRGSDNADCNKNNFYGFVLKKYNKKNKKNLTYIPKEELSAAIIGVLGMMRFADHQSPILLEVLGDLVLNTGNRIAARRLASRAYLKASYQVSSTRAKKMYKKKVALLLGTQRKTGDIKNVARINRKRLEADLNEEIAEGTAFFEKIKEAELNWIAAGVDVDAAFADKYYKSPALSSDSTEKSELIISKKKNSDSLSIYFDYRPHVIYRADTLQGQTKAWIDSLFEQRILDENKRIADSVERGAILERKAAKEERMKNYAIGGGAVIAFLLGFGSFVYFRKKRA